MSKQSIKRVILLFIASVFVFAGFRFTTAAASAEEERFIPKPHTLEITDGEFTSDPNGGLGSPVGWNGLSLNDIEYDVVSGIISLKGSKFAEHRTNLYKLNYYYSGNEMPEKSTSGKLGLNDTVLMINARNNAVAYGYRSTTLTINPNTYYKISVDVLTADRSKLDIQKGKHDGAFIQITGDIEITSKPIFTDEKWETHYFFIKGHPYKTQTIQLQLSLGAVTPDNRTKLSQGFALFDTVTGVSLTEKQYYNEISGGYSNYYFEDTSEQDFDDITSSVLSNADFESDLLGWSVIQGSNAKAAVEVEDLGTDSIFAGSKALKFSSLMAGVGGRIGVRSAEFTIERHKYYQVTIWQNDKDLKNGGAQANFSFYNEDDFDNRVNSSHSTYNSPIGTDSWMGNWKMGSIFVKGSALRDYKAVIELWLGGTSSTNTGTGTVYYDNISIREILPADFDAHASSGTVVNIPSYKGETPSDYTALNGLFNEVTYDKETLQEGKPFTPDSWTKLNTSKNAYADTVSGVVAQENGNVLMINNADATALGYASNEITIETNAYNKISVQLRTKDIEGPGAYIFLKSNNKIIASYERIKTDHIFQNFDFFVEGGMFQYKVTLEIWLGSDLNSSGGGYPNHSKGTLYVKSVKSVTSTDAAEFNQNIGKSGKRVFSFSTERFLPQTKTTDISPVLGWTAQNPRPELPVVSGVVNLNAYRDISGVDLNAVSKEDLDLDNNPYALVIASGFNTAFGYKNDFALWYESNTYYKVTFKVATIGIPEGKGALIALGNHVISDINTEFTEENIRYGNKFEDYTFFIKSGADNSISHNVEIWLGQNIDSKTRTSGAVLVNSITVETTTEDEYSKHLTAQDKDTEKQIKNILVFALTDQPDEEVKPVDDLTDLQGPKMEWWLLPTILFSVFFLLVLILFAVRSIPWHKLIRARVKGATYDRAKTMSKIQKEKAKVKGSAVTDSAETEEGENVVVLPGKKPVKIVVRKKPQKDTTQFDE